MNQGDDQIRLSDRALSLTAALLRRQELREWRARVVEHLLADGLFSLPEVRQDRRDDIQAIDAELRSELRW